MSALDGTPAASYIGDLIVGARNQVEHDHKFHVVIQRMNEPILHVNRSKVQLAQDHVIFLGHDITPGQFGLKTYMEEQSKICFKFVARRISEEY